MIKFTQSEQTITPFGGVNFCHSLLGESGIPELIDQHLGPRGEKAEFTYSEILSNHLGIFLTGGDCAEDINQHVGPHLRPIPGLKVCSADTILRAIKQLAAPTRELESDSGVAHFFTINRPLNELMVKLLRATGQLTCKARYTLDYDNQVLATEKYDAMGTYRHGPGYQPGVASIGGHMVYIEGRNGNSPAKYQQDQTLGRAFELLDAQGISIDRFRADSASYQQKVVAEVTNHSRYFYIRANRSAGMAARIGELPESAWRRIRLGTQPMEVAYIEDWRPFGGATAYRLVVSRIKCSDAQGELFRSDNYT